MADVAALIDISGARCTILIGHDWSAAVAWTFATRRIRPIDALVILNVPHPVCFHRTLMLWGEADTALARFTADGTEEFVPNLTLQYLPGVSHWLQQDATEEVNRALIAFLSQK